MKLHPFLRPAAFAALFNLSALACAFAQDPAATASPIPPSKPATEAATPSPSAAVNSTAAATVSGPKKAMLEKYDVNHDGKLDADEKAARVKDRDARRAERLKKYDKNGDGKLDAEERKAMRADTAGAKKP